MVVPLTKIVAAPDTTCPPVGSGFAWSPVHKTIACAVRKDVTLSRRLFRNLAIPRDFISNSFLLIWLLKKQCNL